jgi:hypothetical protein
VALIYLRATLRGYAELRRAVFGLERERASEGLRRSAAVLSLVVSLLLATFVVANFVGPSVPASARPTALPTVSLLTTTELQGDGAAETGSAATPLPVEEGSAAGCLNPLATLTFPTDGATVSGNIEIQGSADIDNFAFYKYEYRSAEPGGVWRAISAGTDPRTDAVLGRWDTSLVLPGEYDFRLVVTDTAGNAPLPCQIRIRILPEGE